MPDNDENEEVPPYLRLMIAEQNFKAGDPLAIDECILACFQDGKSIPNWAMPALALRAKISLGLRSDPAKKGGPHANPERASKNRKKKFAVFCAMIAAQKHGYRGDKKVEIAQILLKKRKINYEFETIEKYYKEIKKEFNVNDNNSLHLLSIFELELEDYEWEEYLKQTKSKYGRK